MDPCVAPVGITCKPPSLIHAHSLWAPSIPQTTPSKPPPQVHCLRPGSAADVREVGACAGAHHFLIFEFAGLVLVLSGLPDFRSGPYWTMVLSGLVFTGCSTWQ